MCKSSAIAYEHLLLSQRYCPAELKCGVTNWRSSIAAKIINFHGSDRSSLSLAKLLQGEFGRDWLSALLVARCTLNKTVVVQWRDVRPKVRDISAVTDDRSVPMYLLVHFAHLQPTEHIGFSSVDAQTLR